MLPALLLPECLWPCTLQPRWAPSCLGGLGGSGDLLTSDTASERAEEVLTVWDSTSVPRCQSQNCTLPKESEVTIVLLARKTTLQTTHSRCTFCTW